MKKVRILNVWGEAYLHMKFKIHHPTPRVASLGVNTIEGLSVHLLHNQFPLQHVKRAAEELAKEGLLDVYYALPGGVILKEENYKGRQTLRDMQDGRVFNRKTGDKYDVNAIIEKFAIPQEMLEGVTEDEVVTQDTILGRIRKWLRGDREKE